MSRKTLRKTPNIDAMVKDEMNLVQAAQLLDDINNFMEDLDLNQMYDYESMQQREALNEEYLRVLRFIRKKSAEIDRKKEAVTALLELYDPSYKAKDFGSLLRLDSGSCYKKSSKRRSRR